MDYEKLYKESLEKAKAFAAKYVGDGLLISSEGSVAKEFNEIFSELRESEDELMRKEAIAIIKQYNIICEREGDKCYTADRVISWLEKQKPAWSEEDENTRNKIIGSLDALKFYVERNNEFDKERIESNLKELDEEIKWMQDIVPQPKQEWSEEYEANIDYSSEIIGFLKNYIKNYGCTAMNSWVDWLKSLKPHWKLSEKQLRALQTAIKDYGICAEKNTLESLYSNLLKL